MATPRGLLAPRGRRAGRRVGRPGPPVIPPRRGRRLTGRAPTKAMAQEGLGRTPPARNAGVGALTAIHTLGGNAARAMERGHTKATPSLLGPGATRVRLARRIAIAAEPQAPPKPGAPPLEVPGLGRPPGAIPTRVAAITRPTAEGGPSGPLLQVTTLAIREVGGQAIPARLAEKARRTTRALPPLPTTLALPSPPINASSVAVHVAEDVALRTAGPTGLEVAATPTLTAIVGVPPGTGGPREATVHATAFLTVRELLARPLEVPSKVPRTRAPRVVTPRPVAGRPILRADSGAGNKSPCCCVTPLIGKANEGVSNPTHH